MRIIVESSEYEVQYDTARRTGIMYQGIMKAADTEYTETFSSLNQMLGWIDEYRSKHGGVRREPLITKMPKEEITQKVLDYYQVSSNLLATRDTREEEKKLKSLDYEICHAKNVEELFSIFRSTDNKALLAQFEKHIQTVADNGMAAKAQDELDTNEFIKFHWHDKLIIPARRIIKNYIHELKTGNAVKDDIYAYK